MYHIYRDENLQLFGKFQLFFFFFFFQISKTVQIQSDLFRSCVFRRGGGGGGGGGCIGISAFFFQNDSHPCVYLPRMPEFI